MTTRVVSLFTNPMKMKNILWVGVGLTLISLNLSAGEPEGEAQFLKRVRQLTLEGRRSGEGYFSPDGKNIIFNMVNKMAPINVASNNK